jgi:hypothetical protein
MACLQAVGSLKYHAAKSISPCRRFLVHTSSTDLIKRYETNDLILHQIQTQFDGCHCGINICSLRFACNVFPATLSI